MVIYLGGYHNDRLLSTDFFPVVNRNDLRFIPPRAFPHRSSHTMIGVRQGAVKYTVCIRLTKTNPIQCRSFLGLAAMDRWFRKIFFNANTKVNTGHLVYEPNGHIQVGTICA